MRRLFSTLPPANYGKRVLTKTRRPWKHAGALLSKIESENVAKSGKSFPHFSSGDAVEVTTLHAGEKKPQKLRGVVIAKKNRGIRSSFSILNVFAGEPVELTFPLHSPTTMDVKVLQKSHIHADRPGLPRKRVRRSKLYYLRDRPPSHFAVKK